MKSKCVCVCVCAHACVCMCVLFNDTVKCYDSIMLLHNNAHSHVTHKAQEKLNAM